MSANHEVQKKICEITKSRKITKYEKSRQITKCEKNCQFTLSLKIVKLTGDVLYFARMQTKLRYFFFFRIMTL